MKMICPKAKRCWDRFKCRSFCWHSVPHMPDDLCKRGNHDFCPAACVPVKAKKGKRK